MTNRYFLVKETDINYTCNTQVLKVVNNQEIIQIAKKKNNRILYLKVTNENHWWWLICKWRPSFVLTMQMVLIWVLANHFVVFWLYWYDSVLVIWVFKVFLFTWQLLGNEKCRLLDGSVGDEQRCSLLQQSIYLYFSFWLLLVFLLSSTLIETVHPFCLQNKISCVTAVGVM